MLKGVFEPKGYSLEHNPIQAIMINGELRFKTLDHAIDFVEMHARAINTNKGDVIYEVFYERDSDNSMHVGHFWY